ncbi:hypothetical protein BJ123_113114 [Rhodopseudomonas thermotolerans]|uniref:Uncharacterized protein n=2 Tax=Rhodopseudomonas TaxID=1073 RepID=A0A336JQ47_9BRAD|nr:MULTISPECIES: hypothetical protein [Rhodopseudomonas]RED32020.1 hypothetical protein BJ125_113114 [Rhodopseudomonas pentothenatexigens]REF93401.1 hypothetical protein BJ123_113114 [Rhodopseudomonas thermotolerans]SSW91692.1 hypothetical protein SAMN05892882_113114 [Rhodopseudomonas pentothenatexigens]
MRLSDVECECGALYRCAESETLEGEPGNLQCASCGRIVEAWQTRNRRVYRCMLTPDRSYPVVTPPPAP